MRVPLTTTVVAVALLFQAVAQADPTLQERFNFAAAVVLVQVVESTYPSRVEAPDYYLRSIDSTAKLLVLRSWKGPFTVGTTITAATQQPCAGLCTPYPFHAGQEVVVLIYNPAQPIHAFASPGFVIDGVHVEEAMRVLDEAAAKTGT